MYIAIPLYKFKTLPILMNESLRNHIHVTSIIFQYLHKKLNSWSRKYGKTFPLLRMIKGDIYTMFISDCIRQKLLAFCEAFALFDRLTWSPILDFGGPFSFPTLYLRDQHFHHGLFMSKDTDFNAHRFCNQVYDIQYRHRWPNPIFLIVSSRALALIMKGFPTVVQRILSHPYIHYFRSCEEWICASWNKYFSSKQALSTLKYSEQLECCVSRFRDLSSSI